jgi:hypothetical protein
LAPDALERFLKVAVFLFFGNAAFILFMYLREGWRFHHYLEKEHPNEYARLLSNPGWRYLWTIKGASGSLSHFTMFSDKDFDDPRIRIHRARLWRLLYMFLLNGVAAGAFVCIGVWWFGS